MITKRKEGEKAKEESSDLEGEDEKGYDYLLSMALWSLTKERVEKLKKDAKTLREQLEQYRKVPIKKIWLSDLDDLEAALEKYEKGQIKNRSGPKAFYLFQFQYY